MQTVSCGVRGTTRLAATRSGALRSDAVASRLTGLGRRLQICTFLFAIVILDCFSSASAADDDVWSIARLNAEEDHWSDLIDKPLKVEGRVSAVSKFQFRFVHCDLTFHVTEEQSRQVGLVRNVEVSGRFIKVKETGKLMFAVDRVHRLGSDVDQFDAREYKLKSTDAADWFELADWAQSRGKFYDDEELAGRTQRARKKGVQLERQSLPEGDDEARFAMAAKLNEWKLEPALREELIHEGARLKWQAAKEDAARRGRFAEWLKTAYPRSATPLKEFPAELNQKYSARPLETFASADEPTRRVLKRLFYMQVALAEILDRAQPDGGNAADIAKDLKDLVPEREDLIEAYRESAFQWRLKSIAGASRQEALRLAEDLKSRDDSEAARELLRGWIQSRETRLRKDGPIGLMQLAEDYLQLVEEEPTAVKLLAEAQRLDPSFSDPGERLKQLGYRLDDDRWVKGDGPDAGEPAQKGHGELELGMSAADVLALLGTPTAKGRIITGEGMQEVWSFGRRGTPRLLIHLQRFKVGTPPKVTRFLTER